MLVCAHLRWPSMGGPSASRRGCVLRGLADQFSRRHAASSNHAGVVLRCPATSEVHAGWGTVHAGLINGKLN